MIVVRPAETDADLEAWIQVRRAVLPNESAGTLTELREREDPERLLLIAELDEGLAGSGLSVRSDISDRFFLAPRVLPYRRRRGVGTALLRELLAHAESYVDEVSLVVEDEGSRAFAERFGFREVGRQVEQVKALGEEPPAVPLPAGVEVVSVGERPELLRESYELASQGYADLATDRPASISLRQWLHEEATLPEGSFVALAGEEIVGFSGLL